MSQLQMDLRAHARRAPSFRVAIVFWGGLALLDAAGTAGLSDLVQLLLMAALVAGCCRRTTRGAAVLIAGTAWLLVNGFVVNDLGRLHFTGAGDLFRLALLVIVGVSSSSTTGSPE